MEKTKQPQQLATLFPNYNLSMIEDCQKLTVKAKNLAEVWNSNEPTFNAIKRELGALKLKALLYIKVGELVNLFKADMQEQHIEEFTNHILQYYPSYTLADLHCFKEKLLVSDIARSWGKPCLQNFTTELNRYSTARQEFAVSEHVKMNSQHRADNLEADEFHKMYARLKIKARQKVKPQKEKDQEARAANDEKIKEMMRIYGTDDLNKYKI